VILCAVPCWRWCVARRQRRRPPAPTPLVVQLSWTHQVQFAGLYVADQKGVLRARGPGGHRSGRAGPNSRVDRDRSWDGAAQFGGFLADNLILARAQGKPVRAIVPSTRRSPRVYMALADSGIARPQDFIGKRIAVGQAGRPMLSTLLRRVELDSTAASWSTASADLTLFYTRQVMCARHGSTTKCNGAEKLATRLTSSIRTTTAFISTRDVLFASDDFVVANRAGQALLARHTQGVELRGGECGRGWAVSTEVPAGD